MSHVHLPDGVLPPWLWIMGYIVIVIYLVVAFFYIKNNDSSKKYALIGILSALMLVTMSIEIPFIPYHANLAALSGIILGPVLSVLSIFVVNIILAFLGHGGVTVIGLNTIAISIEAIAGYFGFKFFRKYLKDVFKSAFLATFIALILSASVTIGFVYAGTHNLNESIHSGAEKDHQKDQSEPFDINKFMAFILAFGVGGWFLESVITAFVINYISRIKPDILEIEATNDENS